MSPGTDVLLSACPASLCTEPACKRPLAGPSGSPGARQTKSTPSPGPSAQPASRTLLWVCLVPRSSAAAQNRQWPADAQLSGRLPPWFLWARWWGHPRLDPHDLKSSKKIFTTLCYFTQLEQNDKSHIVELARTFGWGPVVYSVRGL